MRNDVEVLDRRHRVPWCPRVRESLQRRRCATRTNRGTLKGTHLGLPFAIAAIPLLTQGHHGTRRSPTGQERYFVVVIPAEGTMWGSLIAGSSRCAHRFTTLAGEQPTESAGARSSRVRIVNVKREPLRQENCGRTVTATSGDVRRWPNVAI
jgi:hypothetical protein